MAVSLESHKFIDIHSSKFGNTSNIISSQVNKHHMLGTFFGVLFQFARQFAILLVIYSAFSCARNRSTHNATVAQLHHRLGRRANDRHVIVFHVIHVRTRVNLSQHAVNIERVSIKLHIKSLRQYNLKNVSCTNVIFCNCDSALIHAVRHRRFNAQRVVTQRRLNWGVRNRSRQIFDTFIYADNRRVIRRISRRNIKTCHWHAFNHVATLTPVIKRCKRADHAHHCIWHVPIFVWRVWQIFDFTHNVVAEKTHQATLQWRQVWVQWRAICRKQRLNSSQYSFVARHRARHRACCCYFSVAQHQSCYRVATHKRKSAPSFAVLD